MGKPDIDDLEDIVTEFGKACITYMTDRTIEATTGKKFLAQAPKPSVAAAQIKQALYHRLAAEAVPVIKAESADDLLRAGFQAIPLEALKAIMEIKES